jgi:hypothetical protein
MARKKATATNTEESVTSAPLAVETLESPDSSRDPAALVTPMLLLQPSLPDAQPRSST